MGHRVEAAEVAESGSLQDDCGVGSRMIRPCVAVLLGAWLGCVASAGVASAQAEPRDEKDAKAKQLFNAGKLAYEEGHFESALENFRAAYELSGRTALLYNLGKAAERARRDDEALEAYEKYMAGEPDPSTTEYVEQRIAFLREQQAKATPLAVPPPEQTNAGPVAATQPGPADRGEETLVDKWWFWGIVGVGVAAITVTIAVAASGEDDPKKGDVGGVITTLSL